MAAIDLPRYCTHLSLLKALGDADALAGDWDKLVIRLTDGNFVSTSAIAFLATWGSHCCEQGKQIKFIGGPDTQRYLSRIDLFMCLGFEFEETFTRHNETGRFIPVKLVGDDRDVKDATDAICDLILRTFDNGRAFLPAVEWTVNELIDNIHLHSDTPVPGAITAQYFPKRLRLDIGICDIGRGIKASLGEVLQPWESHGAAISKAVQRGVTRDRSIGQGNGLAGSIDIARLNGGVFNLWSGDVNYALKFGKEEGFQQLPTVPGTGLFLSLDTKRPVKLEDTFIGERDWGYINVLAEQVEDQAGRLLVAEECIHYGGRNSAKSLRRKVEAVLPEMSVPVILDFSGIEVVSSSFLDELVGRLVEKMGVEEFNQKVRLANCSDLILNMANVVTRQRIDDN